MLIDWDDEQGVPTAAYNKNKQSFIRKQYDANLISCINKHVVIGIGRVNVNIMSITSG